MKKNLVRIAFSMFMLFVLTTSAYPQWVQTNWQAGNSFFNLYSNQGIVFARTWDSLNGGRVFLTGDNGISWYQICSAESGIDILSIVMWNDNLLAGTWDGFYRSTLSDPNWYTVTTTGIPSDSTIWSISRVDNTLLAGTDGNVYESSINDTDTWTKLGTGIPANSRINSIVKSENVIFAGSDSNGVFIIPDGGTSWTAINAGLINKHISQLTIAGTKVFAVTLKGVFVFDADSTSWRADDSGLKNINCLLPVDKLLFAGTDSNGVYLSPDSGLNWFPINSGMPSNIRIWSLAKGIDNIFAGTSEGIWRINPSDINNFTITASASEGGTISPEGDVTVYGNATQMFKITPEQGYAISSVIVDGNSVGAVSTYTFTDINKNHTISAVFVVAPYTIIASAGSGGSISPSGTFAVTADSSHTFAITPSEGYEISDVFVDGVSVGAVTSYTFSSVVADHTITASFSSFVRYQINCGGDTSLPYIADQYYNGGSIHSVTKTITTDGIANPAPQEVYQTERFGTVTYTFPNLTSGTSYKVRLHFSENMLPIKGLRKFDVMINETKVLTNYDIYEDTGAMYQAVVKEYTTTANTTGQIVIKFITVKNSATIGGIEIIKQ